jgi:ligand-binding sensor domain-containing protein
MPTVVGITVELSMITKRIIQTLLLVTGLLTVCKVHAQEYNYIHYDVKDGLAGSTVYDLCQDKDGFIWFATEAGISRFDGTHFKNFTTTDGLPETEIIKLFADSKGRIWMAPFKNNVCYYYNGKIHNQENDSVLKKIHLASVISFFHESSDHVIGFNSDKEMVVIGPDNSTYSFKIQPQASSIFLRPNLTGKGFQLNVDDSCFIVDGANLVNVPAASLGALNVNDKLQKVRSTIKITAEDYTPRVDNLLFSNSYHGSWMVDTTTFDHYEEVFLQEKQISHALVDKEKNIWFATLGEGIYKLASREFKSHYFCKNSTQEIFSIAKVSDKIYAGTAFGRIYMLHGNAVDTLNANKQFERLENYNSTNRITFIKQIKDGSLLIASDGLLLRQKNNQEIFNIHIYANKSIDELDNGLLLAGTGRRTLLVDPENLVVKDTIFPNRTTSVCFYDNTYYIGTVNGLYLVSKDKQVRYMGDVVPSLRQRISYFCKSSDGRLFIATYGAGIICVKDGRVINQITTHEGLSSNICRTLFINNNFLWAGTDKGLNKINISQTPYPVTTYSTSDGLPTDIINAVYVDGNIIYVGSPAGVTWFDETKVANYSKCNLRILDISVGNKVQPLHNSYRLHYRENSLKIYYAGISFKSGGSIWYRYRLKGLTDTWDSTTQNMLEYPSLPPGNYQLEMIAINKKGIHCRCALLANIALSAIDHCSSYFNNLAAGGLAV